MTLSVTIEVQDELIEKDNKYKLFLQRVRRDLESQFSKSNPGQHSVWWTLGIDIPLLLLVALLIGLFELGVIPSHQGGYFCNDPALSYRFNGDTVSMAAIVISVLLLPLPILFATELVFVDTEYIDRSRLHQSCRNAIWLYRSYAYGLFLNLSVVEVMKMMTGMPRPTFFDICNPDVVCQGTEFVQKFKCTPSDRFSAWFQKDSYHSFPSGHTSLSIHCGLFLAWYLQRRAFHWSHRTVFVVPVLQLCLLSFSALCSLTRITDHRHHWWDVLTGTLIGVISMLYSVLVLCRNFAQFSSKSSEGDRPPSSLLYQRRPELIS